MIFVQCILFRLIMFCIYNYSTMYFYIAVVYQLFSCHKINYLVRYKRVRSHNIWKPYIPSDYGVDKHMIDWCQL